MSTQLAAPSVAVARQPILDVREGVEGYELLHRGQASDGEQATAQVLVAAFGDLGLHTLVGGRLAFVNVSRRFLLEVDPLPLPPESVVLELLEDQLIDDALVARVAGLTRQGFRFALDDFVYAPEADPLLELATIVKIDVMAGGVEHAARQAELLRRFDVRLLAEKVEDEPTFEACRELGYELFQGYFFCRPVLVSGREIPAASVGALRDIAVLSRADATFEEIEEVVVRDPGLSLRLLRLLNSAAYSLRREITTVHEAVTMLGARTVRQWAMLLVLGGVRTRCDELVPTALARARALSLLADRTGDDQDAAFSVGLFSVADALLGVPMDEALADLPLAESVTGALLRHEGPAGAALAAVLRHERDADGEPELAECYTQAVMWSVDRTTAAS